jgi:hypothetical protein
MSSFTRALIVLINGVPFLHLALVTASLFVIEAPHNFFVALVLFYISPPIAAQLLFQVFGKPEGQFDINTKAYFVWWAVAQLQAIFVRVPAFEEILRIIPFVYSNWLRLWGARIGAMVYWGPRIMLLDRPWLSVGSRVIIGYGTGFTSHLVSKNAQTGKIELLLATPRVEDDVILGGLSGLGPGSEVAEGEMLPSTLLLAPFYRWEKGRRVARRS